jgi:HD-GYP domain-containing protein (c-di-GMP phosphodiesterase class II)
MSDTQVLLQKIAALRQQLEEVQGLGQDAASASAGISRDAAPTATRVRRLEFQVATGSRHEAFLESTIRQLSPEPPAATTALLPKQLTARARRVLEQGGRLLEKLRTLSTLLDLPPASDLPPDSLPDPLASRYQETTAMVHAALRAIQSLPNALGAQLRVCEGLEAIVAVVAERIQTLAAALNGRQRETFQVKTLTQLLSQLAAGKPVPIEAFFALAETLAAEAQQGAPLRFLYTGAEQPDRFAAQHSLTVGQVVARVVRHDPDFRSGPLDPVVAALVHDVGMLSIPTEILTHAGPLSDGRQRTLESHTRTGAEILTRAYPERGWLAVAASAHHERLDGTGYPSGHRDGQLSPLVRLLAVCDVYAAMCSPRPYRPALDTRTALADTLLMAEQGGLDRYQAEHLLQLSFYPVGSIVELAEGSIGMVVATNMGRRDLGAPARPVLAMLMDSQGSVVPPARHVDLAQCEGQSIVRTLPTAERRALLGKHYPEYV